MNALIAKLEAAGKAAWQWIKDKAGRVLMAAGAFVGSIDGLDITAVKAPLEKMIGEAHVAWITVGLFAAGFWRSQHVATKYSSLLQAHTELQAAHADLQAKVAATAAAGP